MNTLRFAHSRISFRPPTTALRHFSAPAAAAPRKTAIITGAARGIGKAIALRLAHDGYDLTLNDLPSLQPDLNALSTGITTAFPGRRVHAHAADVTSFSAVGELVQSSVAALGPLTTMVANAGICRVRDLLNASGAETEQDFRRLFDVNVLGVQNCYQAAATQMLAQGTGGKLLGAASGGAFKPMPEIGMYCASKFAVRGLTQAWAMRLAGEGITVNAYAPGIVGTDMWDGIDEGLREMKRGRGERVGERLSEMNKHGEKVIPMGRLSVVEDVAGLVSFLAGKDSDYMTGQTISIDGGAYMN